MQKDQIKKIDPIIDELLKDNPSQAQIKKMMSNAGLSYSKDQYDQLKSILGRLGDSDIDFSELLEQTTNPKKEQR